jgi:oligopeptide transport system ATP-binding protein
MSTDMLLDVTDLKVHFPIREGLFAKTVGHVYAVDGVSLSVRSGETLGLVGESGCGKTTVGRGILRLVEPTAGSVLFEGQDVLALSPAKLKAFRCKAQIVFQDPYASLNPKMKIGQIIAAPLDIHGIGTRKERKERISFLLEKVGLRSEHTHRYPHEFSGGQRQRIGVARALAAQPQLIIGDEPFSALDVSVQAQVINLFKSLQNEFHLSYLIIAHNLSVVRHISDRIAVMYLGKIVEIASSDDLHDNPCHPYSVALLSSIPRPNPHLRRQRIILEGDVPSAITPPAHCKFHTRCPRRFEPCDQITPELREVATDHWVACHLAF